MYMKQAIYVDHIAHWALDEKIAIDRLPPSYIFNPNTRGLTIQGMVGILMTQRLMGSPEPPGIFRDFLKSTYKAIEA